MAGDFDISDGDHDPLRMPVQVSGDGNHPIVLCNDGTIWYLHYTHNRGNVVEPFTMAWKQFPSIPQP